MDLTPEAIAELRGALSAAKAASNVTDIVEPAAWRECDWRFRPFLEALLDAAEATEDWRKLMVGQRDGARLLADKLHAQVDSLQTDNASLRMQVQVEAHAHIRDNEYLLSVRDRLHALISRVVEDLDAEWPNWSDHVTPDVRAALAEVCAPPEEE